MAKPARSPVTDRNRQLARIHQGKKALGLGEREYRGLLVLASADPDTGLGGLDSSANMTTEQRNRVLAEMARRGFKADDQEARKRVWAGRPRNVKEVPMLRKVEALLADAKRPWSYAHGLAKKMFGRDRVEFLRPDELHKLVAALQADANRHSRKET